MVCMTTVPRALCSGVLPTTLLTERGRERTTPFYGPARGLLDYENFITHENKRKDLVNAGFSP